MNASPVVGVVMGSKSDYEVLLPCLDLLREFAIPHEARIVSAHRTPDWLFQYAEQAEPRGLKIIIAAAGGEGWFPNFPDATPENIAYARAKNLKVGTWTVNRREDMRRLMDLDAICTDRPDLLAELV